MENWHSRTDLIIGTMGYERLQNAKVALFGVGGVGGYTAEALIRAGIGHLDLYDPDTVSVTNLNRQIIALHSTIGCNKAKLMAQRAVDINPDIDVQAYEVFYLPENADQYPLKQYDFVIDAIDTVSAKIELAVRCYNQHIPFISCMGAGNKLQPYFKIADLYQTSVCPLARVMRRELKKRGVKQCTVVYSTEDPQKPCLQSTQPGIKPIPGSLSFVPSSAGLLLASHVIQHLVCKK